MLLASFKSVFALLYPRTHFFNHHSWKLPCFAILVPISSKRNKRLHESKPTACVQHSKPNLNSVPESGICVSFKQSLTEVFV